MKKHKVLAIVEKAADKSFGAFTVADIENITFTGVGTTAEKAMQSLLTGISEENEYRIGQGQEPIDVDIQF